MILAWLFCTYLVFIWLITDYAYRLFRKSEWTALNYQKKEVVQGFGINILIHYISFLGLILGYYFYDLGRSSPQSLTLPPTIWLFTLMLGSLTLLGWIDDRWGDPNVKGFRGHFGRLWRDRQVTTGSAKALFGLFVALIVSWWLSTSWMEFPFLALAILLSMHIFNLLDVRPGRAIKSYWLLFIILLPFLTAGTLLLISLPVFLSTMLLFRYDRRELTMLGDTGSMALGGIFGFQLIAHAPLFIVMLFVILFTLLTIAAERISFTTWIEQHRWLARWDRWGME